MPHSPHRAVTVEKGRRLVIAFDDFTVRQAFNVHTRQANMGFREGFLNPQQVELGGPNSGIAKGWRPESPAKALLLDVVETRRALDIRQSAWVHSLQTLKFISGYQYPFEIADKLLEMVLNTPVKRHKLMIDIIEHLHLGFRLAEEYPGGPGKGFNIAQVFRDLRDDTP